MTQLGFFGDPATVSVPDRLVTAFKDFKAWCAMNKIQSSQTLFMLHAATWMNSNGGKNHAVSLPFLDDKFCMHIYIYICVCVCWISIIEVWKSTTWGAHLTAKAYNARVVVSWLASCLDMAVERRVEEGRLMGQCLAGLEWPQHELLIPSAVAMTPSQNE